MRAAVLMVITMATTAEALAQAPSRYPTVFLQLIDLNGAAGFVIACEGDDANASRWCHNVASDLCGDGYIIHRETDRRDFMLELFGVPPENLRSYVRVTFVTCR